MMPINHSDLTVADLMPRSLAYTLIAGSLIGTGFWAMVTALLVG